MGRALNWAARIAGFDLLEGPRRTQSRIFFEKTTGRFPAPSNKTGADGVKIFCPSGYLVSGEISKLINKGYHIF